MHSAAHRPPIHPLLAIAFGILAVSTASIFIRFAQAEASSLVIAAYRLSIATVVLAPIALRRHSDELKQLNRRTAGLATLSGIFLALHFATWITSLEYTTVASSVVLVSTAPLWVALISPLALREPLSRMVLIGMSIALIGGTIIGVSDSCALSSTGLTCPPLSDFIAGEAFFGDLLALVGALAGAGYLLIGRSLRAKMSLIPYVFIVYGIAALVLVGTVLASQAELTGYTPTTYLWFVLLALVPQLLGHSTFNWALRYLSAAYVSITLLGEPIGSTILAYLFLNEVPSLIKLFGAILILGGIAVASRRDALPKVASDTNKGALGTN